jgi:hypothetical protein
MFSRRFLVGTGLSERLSALFERHTGLAIAPTVQFHSKCEVTS